MPSTTDDSRILSHGDAAAIAYQVPFARNPAPGSRGLPQPCAICFKPLSHRAQLTDTDTCTGEQRSRP
jgi:hypothetical protein